MNHSVTLFLFILLQVSSKCLAEASSWSDWNPWGKEKPGTAFNFPKIANPTLRAPYKSCADETYGIMRRVEVSPCDSVERCPLYRGSNVTLNLEFIPSFPATNVIGSLAGVLSSLLPAVQFGKPENLCESGQVDCPLVPGKVYLYRTSVFVKPQFPSLKLGTRVLVNGDFEGKSHAIACAMIPVEIANPPTRITG